MQSDAGVSHRKTNFRNNAAASDYRFPEGSFPSELSNSRDVGATRWATANCIQRPVSSSSIVVSL